MRSSLLYIILHSAVTRSVTIFFSTLFLGPPNLKQNKHPLALLSSPSAAPLSASNLNILLVREKSMNHSSNFFNMYVLYLPHCLLSEGCERVVYLTFQNRFLVPSQHQFILRKGERGEECRDFTNTHLQYSTGHLFVLFLFLLV